MPSENRQNHLETGQTRSKKYGSILEFHLLSPSSAPGQHGLTAALSQQEGSCFSKLSARLFGNTIPFYLLNTRGTPGRSWNAEDLLGALARCHGTQEKQGAKGKAGFSHPELQPSTLWGTKNSLFFRRLPAVVASHHPHLLPSTCTPIPLGVGETLPPSELILEFWGFNITFGSSQEFPAPGTSPQPQRGHLQGGADPKCRSIIQRGKGEGRGRQKRRGEGEGEKEKRGKREEQPCFQKSIFF